MSRYVRLAKLKMRTLYQLGYKIRMTYHSEWTDRFGYETKDSNSVNIWR